MKAIFITPKQPRTIGIINLPKPNLADIPNGRGVLVKVLQVGMCGTDKELFLGEYGAAPEKDDFLIIGHEAIGRVIEVGQNVTELVPGDYVVATVRRAGSSIYDKIGWSDLTTDDTYYERGINLLHGFLTEYYLEYPENLVKVPTVLKDVGVLLEPMSIVEKGIEQAFEIQRRLKLWNPIRSAVIGLGTIGLLATVALRLRGLDVTTFDLEPRPNQKCSLVDKIGARYISSYELPFHDAVREFGPFDLIFEATGFSPMVFDATHSLAKNGILILCSITGNNHKIEVECDRFNLEFVLGNKVLFGTVNSNKSHFECGISDFAKAELLWPGWLSGLLTHPIRGLDNYEDAFYALLEARGVIKIYVIVSDE